MQQLANQHKRHKREPPLFLSTNADAMKPSLSPPPCSEGARNECQEGKAGGDGHFAVSECGEGAMEEGEEGLKGGMMAGGNRPREAWGDPEKVARQWVCCHSRFMLPLVVIYR